MTLKNLTPILLAIDCWNMCVFLT